MNLRREMTVERGAGGRRKLLRIESSVGGMTVKAIVAETVV